MLVAISLIILGLAGASCFAVGIIWSIQEMVITGITLTAVCIAGMGIVYWFSKGKPTIPNSNDVRYSTNNMNTMKRNKSDTDLELINRESEKNSIVDENQV
jgi:hypothetical protein